jgi:hypothetical protein
VAFAEVTMAQFLTELDARLKDDDTIWVILSPLIYESDIVGRIEVPTGFHTDFASVPRIPIAYRLYGDRAHRESVLHDYLYRSDATPTASYSDANLVFLEAMEVRGKPWYVRWAMYMGVVAGGWTSYHKKKVSDKL